MKAEEAYIFRHALLRDAAYQLHMPADRARLHRLALDILESLLPEPDLELLALELAEHAQHAQAGQSDDSLSRRELAYLQRAAAHAARHYQCRRALDIYERLCRHPHGAEFRPQAELEAALQQIHLADWASAAKRLERLLGDGARLPDELLHRARIDLARCYYRLGSFKELDDLAEQILGEASGERRAEAALALVIPFLERGRREEGTALLEEGIELARCHGLAGLEAEALMLRGTLCLEAGDMERARHWLDEALARQRRLGNLQGEAKALMDLSRLHHTRGDRVAAEKLASEALSIYERLGLQADIVAASGRVAGMIRMQGRYEEAEPLALRGLDVARELGDAMGEMSALVNLGGLYKYTGKFSRGEDCYRRALVIGRRLGFPRMMGHVKANFAQLLHFMGKLDEAQSEFEEGLALLEKSPDRAVQAIQSGRFAALLKQRGAVPRAEALMKFAREVLTEVGNTTDLQAIEAAYADVQPPTTA